MKLFHRDRCPICDYSMMQTYTDEYVCSFCNRYSFYKNKVIVELLFFKLIYIDNSTYIYVKGKNGKASSSTHDLILPGILELDWKNLNKTNNKIKTLMVFA